jgi:phosphoglycerate dehydrogenase-like enzyme
MTTTMAPRVIVAPAGMRDWLKDAVIAGGGVVVDDAADADAVIWTSPRDPDGLKRVLAQAPHLRWVQLPWAGIEHYTGILDRQRTWSAGQGVYADDVAEHVLTLTLAALRDLKRRATAATWQLPSGRSLRGTKVTVFGAGGITRALVPLLAPFDVELTVVRRRDEPFPHAARTVTAASKTEVIDAVRGAHVVILALSLTPATVGLIDAQVLAAMSSSTVLVNVARGAHVDTTALVQALSSGALGAAALDVTDPEPLPDGHPLWQLPNCLITPHCANTPEMAVPVLTRRVVDNVQRFARGEPLLGLIDVDAGY